MDKIDIRDLILRTLKDNEFGTTDQTGNELKIIQNCDFLNIAESVVENLPIYVVMKQRELLVAFACWLQHNGKWDLPEKQADDFLEENSN